LVHFARFQKKLSTFTIGKGRSRLQICGIALTHRYLNNNQSRSGMAITFSSGLSVSPLANTSRKGLDVSVGNKCPLAVIGQTNGGIAPFFNLISNS
jgi:hypothetical protein